MQISFQEFKTKLLEAGLVDHIVVSNKTTAKVYVRGSPRINGGDGAFEEVEEVAVSSTPAQENKSKYEFYFNIGSVESFEEKLEEAQKALGVDPHDFVPIMYTSETSWYQELMRFGPTLLILGVVLLMSRRMQDGMGVGGAGGKGGRGIFNIGKAPITKVDKNAKNKASIYIYFSVCISSKECYLQLIMSLVLTILYFLPDLFQRCCRM